MLLTKLFALNIFATCLLSPLEGECIESWIHSSFLYLSDFRQFLHWPLLSAVYIDCGIPGRLDSTIPSLPCGAYRSQTPSKLLRSNPQSLDSVCICNLPEFIFEKNIEWILKYLLRNSRQALMPNLLLKKSRNELSVFIFLPFPKGPWFLLKKEIKRFSLNWAAR